jgi:transposase, IS30 family
MRKSNKLKRNEYQEIFERYFDKGHSKAEIAKYLGRDRSTIGRALSRDLHPSPFLTTYEKAMHAFEKSRERMRLSRRRLRLKSERIRKLVVFILGKWHWSPEAISGFLSKHRLKISGKAIYTFIKRERRELTEYLRRRGKPRKQRVVRARSYFKEGVPAKKSIHARPPIVESGHWEIDTIHSKKCSKSAVLTLRELSSKHCFYFLLPDLTAKETMRVLFPFFQALPAHMRRTLLSDNGAEFAELYKLEKVLEGFTVYYCDPYKAYQRGSVENANGELRWYFPKKTNFSEVTQRELRIAQYKINGKPMKLHGRRAAAAVYNEAFKNAA